MRNWDLIWSWPSFSFRITVLLWIVWVLPVVLCNIIYGVHSDSDPLVVCSWWRWETQKIARIASLLAVTHTSFICGNRLVARVRKWCFWHHSGTGWRGKMHSASKFRMVVLIGRKVVLQSGSVYVDLLWEIAESFDLHHSNNNRIEFLHSGNWTPMQARINSRNIETTVTTTTWVVFFQFGQCWNSSSCTWSRPSYCTVPLLPSVRLWWRCIKKVKYGNQREFRLYHSLDTSKCFSSTCVGWSDVWLAPCS